MKKCPICDRGTLSIHVCLTVHDKMVMPLIYLLCNYCGCEQGDSETTSLNKMIHIEYNRKFDQLKSGVDKYRPQESMSIFGDDL